MNGVSHIHMVLHHGQSKPNFHEKHYAIIIHQVAVILKLTLQDTLNFASSSYSDGSQQNHLPPMA